MDSRKWSNYNAFWNILLIPKNKFHTSQYVSKYVREIEPSHIQWVQQVAQEVIDDLEFKETPLDESENLGSQYPEPQNIDFWTALILNWCFCHDLIAMSRIS